MLVLRRVLVFGQGFVLVLVLRRVLVCVSIRTKVPQHMVREHGPKRSGLLTANEAVMR